jgi:hypothetical protein
MSSYLYLSFYERSELQEKFSQRVVTFSHLFHACPPTKNICLHGNVFPRKFRNGAFKRESITQRSRMAVQHDHLKVLPLLPSPMMDAEYPSMSYAPAQVKLRPACPTLHVIESTFVRMVHMVPSKFFVITLTPELHYY